MFPSPQKRLIKSIALEVAPRLAVKFGNKAFYDPGEIDWVLSQLGKEQDSKYCRCAYAMITQQSFYDWLDLESEFGEQAEFLREVSMALFKQDALPNFEAYLEYAKIHAVNSSHPTNTSLDNAGVIDFGSDSSGDGGIF
ncbi:MULTISPECIES: hypothetical protein [Vibrio]|uniref:Uncharacterized protein n=2 Tax=Vibrio TaxID=662 RepID=A0A0A5HZK4_PHOS4|nr:MULTISPECIES: hypothetical protein [Vibrio]KGY09745.1 hypothetical protein NM06_02185 [Vibrio sinaloensis]KHD26265.1 hypothetical protein NM09_05830 [Vibrio caribbeanicus]